MSSEAKKGQRRTDRVARHERAVSGGSMPAIGLEAEFTTVVDDVPQRPEDVFGSPRRVIRGPLVHRTGRSYHLPTGGALYFDTGVMEIATPMIEIARGCGARGTRSLWENLGFLRSELDAWEAKTERTVRLVGFSAHYNVSFDLPTSEQADGRSVHQLAYLLTHVLAAPVMLLAANRRSTGVGVRPRGNRVEVTADFTPDAALMAATATLIVGIVREVMTWPDYSLAQLAAHAIPVVRGFVPVPHSSRKGWVAKDECYTANPFTCDVDRDQWSLQSGESFTLREMAGRTVRAFWKTISELGDPTSLQLIAGVMHGRAPSLLELDDRPAAYDDVGRLCSWNDLFPVTLLPRSRYERVLSNAIAGRRVRIAGAWHRPVGVRGWTHVVLRRERDGTKHIRSLDDLLVHLDAWDRSANRRQHERRAIPPISILAERRRGDRREPIGDTSERRRESDRAAESEAPTVKADVTPNTDTLAAAAVTKSRAIKPAAESPLVIIARI
ncbi:MAG: hypothetical protein JWL61_562 [Gemmatimonadetes bacterium]|nr:hypothetical protein [Gemmatimonadota bacterium]